MSDIVYDGKIYEHLSVDVSQPNMFAPPLVKEGDSGTRGFIITVTDNGEPIAIPTTATVWLNCSNTADAEKHASAAGTINSDGTVTVDVPTVVMEVPGLIECDVSIITLSGADETEVLKSTLFCLQCERAANKDGTSTKAEDSILAGIASGEIEVPGASGPQGPAGPAGPQGPAGADGFSPSATVTKSGDTATITITDKNGTTTTTIKDGSGVRIITPEESQGWGDEIPLTFAGELYDIAGWNDKLWVLNQIAAAPEGGTNYFWEPLISAYDFDIALEAKENTANKTSAITAENKTSSTLFPTIGAAIQYIENNYYNKTSVDNKLIKVTYNQNGEGPSTSNTNFKRGDIWLDEAGDIWMVSWVSSNIISWKKVTRKVTGGMSDPPTTYFITAGTYPPYEQGDLYFKYGSSQNEVDAVFVLLNYSTSGTICYLKWIDLKSLVDLKNYYTKTEIDAMIGDIGTALDTLNGNLAEV